MAALQKFSGVRPHPEAFVEALEPLQPRLYSISSSHNATPGKLSLTVDCVRYVVGKRKRLGLASTFLAERIKPGDEIKVYVQKAHGFALPQDPTTPIIMIGPGTGVAPFRAFLHDRRATGATGRNWLFFGDQSRSWGFYYEEELTAWQRRGLLRLDLAFSRDQPEKIYVQHRMRESARDFYAWLEEGAEIFICGDKGKMAADVQRELARIIETEGSRTPDQAAEYVTALKKAHRLKLDVY
jgi:sulfite reductase (NADPH) flavoprotein alpha-component